LELHESEMLPCQLDQGIVVEVIIPLSSVVGEEISSSTLCDAAIRTRTEVVNLSIAVGEYDVVV